MNSRNDQTLLVADIGGTNARFALAAEDGEPIALQHTLQCTEYPTVNSAIDAYLAQIGRTRVDAICFAAAGPVIHGSVKFTNNSWILNGDELRSRFNTSDVYLLNDWEAIAYSLPALGKEDRLGIGGDWSIPHSDELTFAAIGPGTGLGVTGVSVHSGQPYAIVSEGGHTSFAPKTILQLDLLKILLDRFGRVSNERVLSGPGLVNIYQALCQIEGVQSQELSASQIGESARDKSDAIAVKTFELFFEILGQVAGDFVLTLGGYDGLFIGGGVTQRYRDLLLNSRFRSGFTNKGRYKEILENTPSWLILHENPGLLGASAYIQSRH